MSLHPALHDTAPPCVATMRTASFTLIMPHSSHRLPPLPHPSHTCFPSFLPSLASLASLASPPQVALLRPDMPPDLVGPLHLKYVMYQVFLLLVLVSAAMEVVAHSLLFRDRRAWVVLLAYELSNLLVLATMGFVFRPQEYSPFFFMVPARLNDVRTRPIPILEAADDAAADDPEVELSALLQGSEGLAGLATAHGNKMVVLRHPDHGTHLLARRKSHLA